MDVGGLTVIKKGGRGKHPPPEIHARKGSMIFRPQFTEKYVIELMIDEKRKDDAIKTIQENSEKGKIFVSPITETIDIATGKINLKQNGSSKVTYHDSCYLGRYNEIYEAPRKNLKSINSINLVEMNRKKDRGFCCGAGGGRMFLEDEEGGRINEERTREALETGADTIASACPFCMTMMTDGVKHYEKTDEVKVKDIAEIILENSN